MATPVPPDEAPTGRSRLDQALDLVARALASKLHIAWLSVLLVWIVILAIPFPQIAPARVELILGNWTNVTSALGACIAAGATLTLVRHTRRQSRLAEERHKLVVEMHRMMSHMHRQTQDPPDVCFPG